jgi:putative colanic acid biosynthesis glycosyltransferase
MERNSVNRPKSILHVNVRLSEGGAAGVARNIIDTTKQFGHRSRFAYGYSSKGQRSPLHDAYNGLQLGGPARAAINLGAHGLFGAEKIGPGRQSKEDLRRAIAEADVVHLHAIHSYMMPPGQLMKMLGDAGTPVVWTMHDQWLMTGRCAQPDGCNGWQQGCAKCPKKEAYPPALVDQAGRVFDRRRGAFDDMASRTSVVVAACAHWLKAEFDSAGFEDVRVIPNSVDPEFWRSVSTGPRRERTKRFLFVCRDLRDRNKVDWLLLQDIAARWPDQLTVVGDNAPAPLPGAEVRPSLRSRNELAQTMLDHEVLLFTSTVDYYPLTIVEALSAGMQVFARPSDASRELLWHPNLSMFENLDELGRLAAASEAVLRPAESLRAANAAFDPSVMAGAYDALYEEAVSR